MTVIRRLPFVTALLAALFAFVAPAIAQVDTGAIVGTVTDTAGLRIPDAKVTVKEESTGVSTTVTGDNDGSYIISPLKLGFYTLTAEKAGFKISVQRHIEVTIQSRLEVNPKLEVGAVSETVQVTSTAPILETQTSSVQQLVDTRAINDLPLNGRNATFLAQLSAGVTFAQNDTRGLQASGSFTANGFGRTENDYLMDGMDNNSAIGDLVNQTQYVILPPPDALREFTVQTSNYSAEFGHSAGAVLNMTTKSGTNSFHGDVWEFLRNDFFDAKDYFVLPTQRKPEFRRNQFGFTLGGPITIPHVYSGKDRTFFFVDYQGFRQVQGQTYTESVPTLAEQNSGFTNMQDLIALQSGTTTDLLGRTFPKGAVFDPATTRAITKGVADPVTHLTATATGYVRDPFYTGALGGMTSFTTAAAEAQMNTIASSRISPVATTLLRLYPNPNGSGLTSNYTSNPNNTQHTDSMDSRIDQQFGASDSIFFRYSYLYQTQFQGSPFPGVADGAPSRPGTGETESQNGALGWTHTITTHLVNEARVGYSRIYDKRFQYDATVMGIPAQYGIPGVPQISENGGLPLFTFNQLSNLGAAGTNPSDKASDVFQVTENMTIDRDKHQLRTGIEYQHVAYPMLTPTQPRGNFTNNGIFTSVINSTDPSTDRAQFIIIPALSTYAPQQNYLGGANSLTASSFPPAYYPIRTYYGAYVEDNYRVTQALTLNLGVRYEYIGSPTEKDGRFGSMVSAYTGDSPDGLSHYYVPAENVSQLPTNFLTLLAANNIVLTPSSNSIGDAQRHNFAPRVGFSFQPHPKLALRGGFGIFYQPNESHGLSTAPYVDFPFQISASYTDQSAQEAIIANPTVDTTPEGTVGPVYDGLENVPLTAATASIASLSFNGEPRYPKTTYGEAYNLQLQYQVGRQTILYAGYVGGSSHHVETNINTNATNTINPPSTALSSILFFKTIASGGSYIAHSGQSNYNSLQFGGERRFSGGFSFIANMTWSKCLGDTRDLLDNANLGSYRAPYVPGMGIGADYSLCTIDVRRIVHTSGIYDFPFGANRKFLQHGPASWLAGGWELNWIFTAQDGQPLSIACTTTNASGLGCFALKVPGQGLYAGPHNVNNYFNYAAFANPPAVAAGTIGTPANLGGPPGQVTGPPFRRLDTSLFRRFPAVRETYFEFRAEVFNILNTPNFGQPGSLTFTSPTTFAKITATRDAPNDQREIQLSGKFYF